MYKADNIPTTSGLRRVVEFFDADYRWWEGVYETTLPRRFFSFEMIKRRELVLDLIKRYQTAGTPPSILECGCGPGGILGGLDAGNGRLSGVDINLRHLQQGRSRIGRKIAWIQADVEQLPFRDQSFDIVCCVGVLSYLAEDEPAVREIARVCKAGGVVIMALPNRLLLNMLFDPYYYLAWAPQRLLRRFSAAGSGAGGPKKFNAEMIRRYRHGKIDALFRRHGLVEVEHRSVSFGPLTLWRRELLPLRWSMNLSESLLALGNRRGFALLRHVTNHWISCLAKTSP